jgi:4-hydroxy-3-methylbut-2-enyl diphosphate reductase
MVKIEVDDQSGFCTGVVRAVEAAEKHLGEHGKLYSLGELVHNPAEVARLSGLGLQPVNYHEFDKLKDTTVLIRAHGEPTETFRRARENRINLIDATCPIVLKLQERIRNTYNKVMRDGGSILLFGKSNHPEVRALLGQTGGTAIVVRDTRKLADLELKAPVYLYSQTTMNPGEYDGFFEFLKLHLRESGMDPEKDLNIQHTICGQVSSRDRHLREFVAHYDLVLFVSGKESSNGRALYKVCMEVNSNTYFISSARESDPISLAGVNSIGICGATSTPHWLLKEVKEHLEERLKITGS